MSGQILFFKDSVLHHNPGVHASCAGQFLSARNVLGVQRCLYI